MNVPVRVLILEDRPSDAELMVEELRRGGFEPVWKRVDTEARYLSELERAPDVILADYKLPSFDASRALQALQERGEDIPFIVITGTMNDEEAVEFLRRGAADYLLKDRMARLGQAVRRALEENKKRKEARQQEASLRQSEERFRTIVEEAPIGIGLVGADHRIVKSNKRLSEILGYAEEELISLKINDVTYAEDVDKDVELAGRLLRGDIPGYELETRLVRKDGQVRHCRITTTLIRDQKGQPGLGLGMVEDITERKEAQEKIEESLAMLRRVFQGTVQAMALTVEMRDPYTAGHERRVAEIASAIATEMGLPEERIEGIRTAGLLHDIGKIAVPAEILSKPGRISREERSLIEQHCQVGYDILNNIEFPWPVARMVVEHHECMNGSGYPYGLSEGETLLESRILAVADVVEAMSSHRPYRPALGEEKALQEVIQKRGTLYDPAVVDICCGLMAGNRFRFQ